MPRKIEPRSGFCLAKTLPVMRRNTPRAGPVRSIGRPPSHILLLLYVWCDCSIYQLACARGDTTRPGTLMRKTERRTTRHTYATVRRRPAVDRALLRISRARTRVTYSTTPIGRMDARTTLRAVAPRPGGRAACRWMHAWMDRARGGTGGTS